MSVFRAGAINAQFDVILAIGLDSTVLLDWGKFGPVAPDPKRLDLVPDSETMGLGIPYQILGVSITGP